jgi:uroporphyrinogen decarboxylase
MTPKERLRMSLNHKEPDRVPSDLGGVVTGITRVAHHRLLEYLGIEKRGSERIIDRIQQLVIPDEHILNSLHIDSRYVYMPAPKEIRGRDLPGDIWEDEWGVRRKKAAYYYDIVESPFSEASLDDLNKVSWPDPYLPARFEGLEEEVRRIQGRTDYPVIVNAIGSIFEFAWYLRGYENFMSDLLTNPRFSCALMDRMLEFQMGLFEEILERTGNYVDVVLCGDDIGIQKGPVISLQLYRKCIKPRQRKLYDMIKRKTKAKLFYHSCGSVYAFIPDLIDIGIDVLNPVQVSAEGMNTKRLKKEFGKEITFWGGIDTQHVLPYGSPGEVEDEVKRRLDDLAPGGGYVLGAVHNIQPDVPPENVVAMFEAGQKYGSYS